MPSAEDDMGQVNGWGHPRWKAKKADPPSCSGSKGNSPGTLQQARKVLHSPARHICSLMFRVVIDRVGLTHS